MYYYALHCGHIVKSDILIQKQYDDDYHFVLCPFCKEHRDNYARPNVPTAWQQIKKVTRDKPVQDVPDVSNGNVGSVSGNDIIRIQPSVPRNRVRPFRYATPKWRR